MTATTDTATKDAAGVWITLRESSVPVRAMLAGIVINQLGGFLQTFLVLFLTQRGFSEVHAGFALGCYGAGCFAGVIIGGAFSDRLGPRSATFASMGGFAVLLIVVLYVRNFQLMVAAVTLAGVVGRFYRPAASAMLSELTPKNRQVMIFAVYRLSVNIGQTASPLVGTLLIAISYQALFWADALTALAYAVIAVLTLPRRPLHPREKDRAVRRAGGYRAVFTDRKYVLFLVSTFVNSAIYLQYVSVLPLAMKNDGLAMVWYSLMVTLNGAIVISSELFVTKFTQRLPIRVIFTLGFGLLGIGQLIYAIPWGVFAFTVGTFVWTLAEITAGPTFFSYPGLIAPDALRGRYIASMQTMFSLGAAVGPAVGVVVYRAVGSQIWLWCGVATAVGLGLALLGLQQPDTAAHEPSAAEPASSDPADGAGIPTEPDGAAGRASEAEKVPADKIPADRIPADEQPVTATLVVDGVNTTSTVTETARTELSVTESPA